VTPKIRRRRELKFNPFVIRTKRSNNWTYKFFIGTNYLQGGLPIERG
jgi:hypothetical protein